MPTVTWHFLENQFDTVTRSSRRLMDDILTDHHSKLTGAVPGNAALGALVTALQPAFDGWQAVYGGWKNAEAGYRSATQAVELLFEQLQVQPSGGGRSKIDGWESKVAAHWAANDPNYDFLLPRGRESFTSGSVDEIIGEVKRFGERLTQKSGEITLYLGTAEGQALPVDEQDALNEAAATTGDLGVKVTAFYNLLLTARTVQTQKEGAVDQLAGQAEAARVAAAVAMYKNLGSLMAMFSDNPQEVAGFYDLALIISPPQPQASSSSSSAGPAP